MAFHPIFQAPTASNSNLSDTPSRAQQVAGALSSLSSQRRQRRRTRRSLGRTSFAFA